MQSAALPDNEPERLAALRALEVLDTPPEPEFDALVQAAALVCGTPISLISLVDAQRQWFKANLGLGGTTQSPRELAFCAHAILHDALFLVPDATQDPRFFDNPLVTTPPGIRFYAGAPIVLGDGQRIGTLCVCSHQPQQLDARQQDILRALALTAAHSLQGRRALRSEERMHHDLRQTRALLDRTSALAGVGGWELTLPDGRLSWTAETRRIHGMAPNYQPTLAEALTFYAPEARATLQAAVAQAMSGGPGFDLELPFIRASGERIWVRAMGSVEFEDGQPRRLTGVFQDISTRRAQQMALQEAQQRMQLATESAGIGIWDLDLLTGQAIWDAQTRRLFGFAPDDTSGIDHNWSQHIHPDDVIVADQALREAVATGRNYSSHLRVTWPDGSLHHLRGLGHVRYGSHGQALRVVGTNRDITEAVQRSASLHEALEKAEQASISKGQFLANMSHEIRTPMNAVLGMLKLLQLTPLNTQQLDYASKAEGAAQSMLALLNDILDYSKVEAGKMTLESEPFAVDDLLQDLSVVLSASLGGKDLEVLFDIDPALPALLCGDALRLKQVLINLGGNAVKFTAFGQVVLALRCVAQTPLSVQVAFSVQDNGIGIAPDKLTEIFDGFSQAEASTTRRFGGSGLGLAISRRLVALMGGEVQVSSTPDVGSTFAFTLTLARVAGSAAPLVPTSPAPASARVLVVDDNPRAAALTQAMFTTCGWQADVAHGGAQALARVRAQLERQPGHWPYPLVCVDWQMPGLDGWQTLQQLRDLSHTAAAPELPEPRFIMLSANGRTQLAQRPQADQALLSGFLVKPFTAPMLAGVLATLAAAPQRPRPAQPAPRQAQPLKGLRVLVVEDNLINQQVAKELLTRQGAVVALANNGLEGVHAVANAQSAFDVVLMDLQMPELDGFGATHAIRHQLGLTPQQLPIVAMTANALPSDRAACLAAGMNEHVGKPFDLAKLVALLQRVTSEAALPGPG